MTGVVSVAALMDIAFVIVVAAGGCGLWWVGGSHWGFDVLSVDVDHAFTAASLGGIAGAGLGAFANVEEVLVDKGVAAVLGDYESNCKTRREKEGTYAFLAPFYTGEDEALGGAGGGAYSRGHGV